ncbi:MAG: YceD family protein [Candidatus Hydrogenedentota bacterium]
MSKLKISVALVAEQDVPVDVEAPVSELQPEGAPGVPIESVRVRGSLAQFEDGYMFRGKISGAYQHACDRCLASAEHPLSREVLWVFVEGSAANLETQGETGGEEEIDPEDQDAPSVGVYSGNVIDLAPQTWEEVVLAVPFKFLCRPDCAGLCPGCGANLNFESCRCTVTEQVETKNNGLQALAEMFPNLRPGSLEE